jgi:anti-anti-sigma factor
VVAPENRSAVSLDIRSAGRGDRPVVVVVVRGEVDMGTSAQLRDRLAEAVALGPIVVDLAECTLLDSSVVACLFAARRAEGVLEVVLPAEDGAVERTFAVTGLTGVLGCHRSLDDAIDAAVGSSSGDDA